MKVKLDGVEETMLIPLCIKAEETNLPNPHFRDEKAVDIIPRIDYDFSKFHSKKFSHAGVIARSVILDREVKKFIAAHPNAVCICIGCGLDARFYRMDNGSIDWYDLDLPNVMNIRRQLLPPQDRIHQIARSAFDPAWTAEVDAEDRPVIIIMEGLLMYFTEDQVRDLFHLLKENFAGATVLAELFPAALIKQRKHHETVGKTSAVFKWGAISGKDVELLCKGVTCIDKWSLNTEMKKYGLTFLLFGTLPVVRKFNIASGKNSPTSEVAG